MVKAREGTAWADSRAALSSVGPVLFMNLQFTALGGGTAAECEPPPLSPPAERRVMS